jgi:hypothetical protein
MDKEAQIADALAGAGSNIMESLKNAPDNISMFWDALSDTQKSTVINSLAGAAAGGLGSGLLGGDLSDSLVAAALGGAAGGGLTLGYNSLFGGAKLPSELEGGPNALERGLSAVGNPILGNPGTSIGGTLGAWIAAKRGGLPFTDAATEAGFNEWKKNNKIVPTKANLGTEKYPIKNIKSNNLLAMISAAAKKPESFDYAVPKGATPDEAAKAIEAAEKAWRNNPLRPRTFADLLKDLVSKDSDLTMKERAARLVNPQLGRRSIIEKATAGMGASKYMPNRAAWLALPAGLGAGAIADKYIQGEI